LETLPSRHPLTQPTSTFARAHKKTRYYWIAFVLVVAISATATIRYWHEEAIAYKGYDADPSRGYAVVPGDSVILISGNTSRRLDSDYCIISDAQVLENCRVRLPNGEIWEAKGYNAECLWGRPLLVAQGHWPEIVLYAFAFFVVAGMLVAAATPNQTPLHIAAQTGQIEAVNSLVSDGAVINLVNDDGDTPLHLAAANGHRAVAECLLARKAKVNTQNKRGNTPLSLAVSAGHQDIVQLLRESGGR
jgi:hypothetical protein